MFRSLMPARTRGDDAFMSFQREMNRMLDDVSRSYTALGRADDAPLLPSIDVKDNGETIEVEVELPGVDEKDVQVTFEDGALTIKGEKKFEKEDAKSGHYVRERNYGAFYRTLELSGIDAEKISATFAKGVLKVSLPKLNEAQAKSRKIEIKAVK
jgi:HSP20 family protein